MNKIVVIGSSNTDYLGMPISNLIKNDSNIGKVYISSGGVGRNITENLLRLGCEVTFFSAIGNDFPGERIRKELETLNCNLISVQTKKPSSSYIAICDINGDMSIGLCDAQIIDDLNVDFIKKHEILLNDCDFIVVDANVSLELIDYIFSSFPNKRIVVDGISTSKVVKFSNYLDKIYLLKVNEYEYNVIKDNPLITGVTILLITYGGNDIVYYEKNVRKTYKVDKTDNIVNATGAGDALLSGIVCELNKGNSIEIGLKLGIKLARLTLSTMDSVYKGKV